MAAGAPEGPRTIAFYLPQFHQIPENDEWWGEGFTEWTNVRKALPLFPGQHQPHVPADLGYYDLLDAGVRDAQAAMARRYGIDAFCYYHYWFHGTRLLDKPLDLVLSSGEPELPFSLCWANEPWNRVWDGGDQFVLQPQRYSDEDDRRHIDWLLPVFGDDRYVKIDGRPLFLIYRATALPDPRRTATLWRERARQAGFPDLYLCCIESHDRMVDPDTVGFDASVEFQPGGGLKALGVPQWLPRARSFVRSRLARRSALKRVGYEALMRQALARPDPGYLRFPCVFPDWDNTPRRPWAPMVLTGSTPELFGEWVGTAADRLASRRADQRLLFVNAWNEWAEGCHLEPCQRWGHRYLEAFAEALGRGGVDERASGHAERG